MPIMDDLQQKIKELMDIGTKGSTGKGKRQLVEYRGRKFLPGFSMECAEYLKNWNMPEDCILISSFPKTGTTWCSKIVREILSNNDEELLARYDSIPPTVPFLDIGPREKFDLYPHLPLPRKYFITHFSEEFFNFEKVRQTKSKVIYVMRNPKDQAVSWFHFSKKLPINENIKEQLGVDWDQFFANYFNGEHPMGLRKGEHYPDHILGWLKHKDDKNFLVVVYEDLKRDVIGGIRRIAEFLEVKLSEEDLNKVAQKCSISSMQQAAADDKSGFLKINVRKGEVGNWKDQFTVSQSEQMDRMLEEKLRNSGIKFTYTL